MWKLVSVRLEVALVSVQDGCTVCAKVPKAQKSFRMNPMVVLGDKAQVEARFSPLEIVRILTQDRCMVCAERPIGLENILDTPDGSAR